MHKFYIYFCFSILLASCGGSGGGSGSSIDAPLLNEDINKVRVIASNLNGEINLELNVNAIPINLLITNPRYSTDIDLKIGDAYDLSITSSPEDQICEVTSEVGGIIAGSEQLEILVFCKPAHRLTIGAFNIHSDVRVLLNDKEEALIPAGSTQFTFKSKFDYLEGDKASLTIISSPEGYGCSVNRLTAVASLRDETRPSVELYCFLLNQKVVDISANLGTFAALREDGTVFTWGNVGSGGDTTFELKDLKNVDKLSFAPYGKGLAYTAIYQGGSIKSWGGSDVVGSDSSKVEDLLPNVDRVISNGFSQIAVTTDDRVIGWGSNLYGGDVRLNLESPLRSVFQTSGAYAAILDSTKVVAWGSPQFGGDTAGVDHDLNNILDVVSTMNGFAALKEDRTIVTWPASGLVTPDFSDLPKLINVDKLVASRSGFVAILQAGGLVVWGSIGGDLRLLNTEILSSEQWAESQVDVENVIANGEAYAILYRDRTATAFGANEFGADYASISSQLINIKTIVGLNNTVAGAFAALRYDGTVVTWGALEAANSNAVASELINVKEIFHNDYAFVALKEDGRIVAWGDPIRGGDISEVSDQLTNIVKIYATTSAFAALKSDGSIVTWGDSSQGGNSDHLKEQLNRFQ